VEALTHAVNVVLQNYANAQTQLDEKTGVDENSLEFHPTQVVEQFDDDDDNESNDHSKDVDTNIGMMHYFEMYADF